jgi:hypothetical protein
MGNQGTEDLHDITTYSPVRVFLSGVLPLLMGGLFGLIVYALAFAMAKTAAKPASSADPPVGLLYGALVFLGLLAALGLSTGLGRMVSAFARNCFFRAGRDGISIRLPKRRWFGRYRVVKYWLTWDEVDRIVHFTYKTNGIPTGSELRIYCKDKSLLRVERRYFSASVRRLQEELLAIQATVSR